MDILERAALVQNFGGTAREMPLICRLTLGAPARFEPLIIKYKGMHPRRAESGNERAA